MSAPLPIEQRIAYWARLYHQKTMTMEDAEELRVALRDAIYLIKDIQHQPVRNFSTHDLQIGDEICARRH